MLAEMIAAETTRQKLRENSYRWRLNNLERSRENQRRWRAVNREKIKSQARARYALDPASNIEKQRKWRTANPGKVQLVHRKSKLKLTYGITIERRNEILKMQGGACAVCKSSTSSGRFGWHTDHCHKTKIVRGILCQDCNLMLGHARDKIEILRAAISYLEKGTLL